MFVLMNNDILFFFLDFDCDVRAAAGQILNPVADPTRRTFLPDTRSNRRNEDNL